MKGDNARRDAQRMGGALEREVTRDNAFVRDVLAAKSDIEKGGAVYRAEDVHAWMERLAKGEKPPRPAPWRR